MSNGSMSPLFSAAGGGMVASGRAVPIIAHEDEWVGTPARLAQAGIGSNVEVNLNFYGGNYDARSIAEEIGYEIERELKYARGI